MALTSPTITLRVAGQAGEIDVEAFLAVFKLTIAVLQELNKEASEFGAPNLQWRITAAGMSSPFFATMHGVGISPEANALAPRVVQAFVSGIGQLGQADTCPRLFTESALRSTNHLARTFARGITRIEFSSNGDVAVADQAVAENAERALRKIELENAKRAGRYVEYGELEGQMKELSELAGRDKIVIADDLTGKKTPCYFRGEALEEKARGAWKRRVVVTGEITVDRQTGDPVGVLVDEIRVLGGRSELPQIDDLVGMDISDGLESSEYVRSLRDAE